MKHRRCLYIGIMLCVFLNLLTGCFTQPKGEPTLPEDIYASAISEFNIATGLSIQVTRNKHVIYHGQAFQESSVLSGEYRNVGTDRFCAEINENISIGQHLIETEATLSDGTVYLRVNDGYFYQQPADLSTYAPKPLYLSPALYGAVSSAELYGRTVLCFYEASAPESWAVSDEVEFITASGIAVLDESGTLKHVQYALQYKQSDARICERFLIDIATSSHSRITPPNDADYILLTSLEAPVLLEKACGYLLQAQCIASNATETLDSEVGGLLRSQSTQLRVSGEGSDLNAWIDTGITLINSSRGDETTTLQQTEQYQNGEYRIMTDGTAATPEENVTTESLQRYCNDILVGAIPLPIYITSAELAENDGILELNFQASDELAAMISANACQVLYQDATVLDSISSDYTIKEMASSIRVDKVLGIPMTCSLHYSASHTIEGAVYNITSQIEQSFALIDTVFE